MSPHPPGRPLDDTLAAIRRITETLPERFPSVTLPERFPSVLRTGPYVAAIMLRAAPRGDVRHDVFGLPLGVQVVIDDTYQPGEWRLLDQRGQELHAGSLWPPHLPVVESDLLPAHTAALIYDPPAPQDGFGPEPCVVVRHKDRPMVASRPPGDAGSPDDTVAYEYTMTRYIGDEPRPS